VTCTFCNDEFDVFVCEYCRNEKIYDECKECHEEIIHHRISIQNVNLAGNSRVSHLDSIDNDPDAFGFADP
jgi:hypothetical protein